MNNPFKDLPYFYGDRNTDLIVKAAYEALPSSNTNELPKKWFHRSVDWFLRRYPELGIIVWSRKDSYHLLLINGNPVLRIWNVHPNEARVEMVPSLLCFAFDNLSGVGLNKKTKWFSGSQTITSVDDILKLMQEVKRVYGL